MARSAMVFFLLLVCFNENLCASELTVEACASATVIKQTPANVMSGFPEECIRLTAEADHDGNLIFKAKSDSETRSFAFGGCNTSGTDVEVELEHRWRYNIEGDLSDWTRVNVQVLYDLAPDVYIEGSGSFRTTASSVVPDGYCVDYLTHLSASYHAVAGSSFSLVNDQDMNGLFHDPANPGHGFDFNVHSEGFTAYYYGHTDSGERLWLISELLEENLEYYRSYELDLYEVINGRFGEPDFEPALWGTLRLTLYDCNSGSAELSGIDGQSRIEFVRLTEPSNSTCDSL